MASIQENLQSAGVKLPSYDFSGAGDWILYIIFAFLILGMIGAGVYFLVQFLRYNKKIVLFRKVAGKVIPVGRDKGCFERVGLAGDYWCRTRKFKKILARPKILISKDEYWFFEREDGEWINFGVEDIDYKQKEAKVYYIDEDMRLQRLGIQRNLQERLNKVTFWQKYGNIIVGVVFLLIITICLVIIFNKINDLVSALPELAKALTNVANAMRDTVYQPSLINATSGG